jgi:2-isopropylmalate synthase
MDDTYIYLFDTTLRDGIQCAELINTNINDKINYINIIQKYNFDYIELSMLDNISKEELEINCKNKIYLSLPRIENVMNAIKNNIKSLQFIIKSDILQIKEVINKDPEKYLEQIIEVIQIANKNNIEILCILEHFFDSFKTNKIFIYKVIDNLIKLNCKWITFADTNGNTLTKELEDILDQIYSIYNFKNFGIHAHNDIDLATSNSISAVNKGIRMVQGTWNGMGERCGNANLLTVFCNLYFKQNYKCCIPDQYFKYLTESSRKIEKIFGTRTVESILPYIGKNSFSHKAGIHINAINKRTEFYEHINPKLIGNNRNIILSDLIGTSALIEILNERPHINFLSIAKKIINNNKNKNDLNKELIESYYFFKNHTIL